MLPIPREQGLKRVAAENPWWGNTDSFGHFGALSPREYLASFLPLVRDRRVRRAVLLMGPRRVGKTVLIHHAIERLIKSGVPARSIAYVSVDNPIYNECGLEQLMEYCTEASGVSFDKNETFVFFDEIQYLKEWEHHLKVMVDSYPTVKFVASGSAAAALRLKSNESGAGRFTDFLLPPLTFNEYLGLVGKTGLVGIQKEGGPFEVKDIDGLNDEFVRYLNFGGYPESALSPTIQGDPARFIKNDIVDKVLLRDLPSLYGIQDIQELNYLFTTLAYNTANEVSLEELSKNSGVAKNTIKRYIEYLEAAFLIRTVHRVDRTGQRFQRANFFKIYLTNPSIRAALFAPVTDDDPGMSRLTETAIFSQWFHLSQQPMYSRWSGGEVDLVWVEGKRKIAWAVEVKWSDRYFDQPGELESLRELCRQSGLKRATVTTKTKRGEKVIDGIRLEFIPSSLYCFVVGYNILRSTRMTGAAQDAAIDEKQIDLPL